MRGPEQLRSSMRAFLSVKTAAFHRISPVEASLKRNSCKRAKAWRKRRLWFVVLPLVLAWQVIFAGGYPAAAANTSPVVLRLASGEWPPYTGKDLPHQGCDSQVVAEAFALEGIRVEYTFLPWARAFLLSKNGVMDGTVEWAGNDDQRASHFISKDYISAQQWVFFHRANRSFSWKILDDLSGLTIGLTIGYIYSDIFIEMQRRNPRMFAEAASDLLNFRKLLNGRIDLLPLERAVGQYLIRTELNENEQAQLTADSRPLADFHPRVLLSRAVAGNEERMHAFDRGLQRLKKSGRYQEIMAGCTPAAWSKP